MTQGFALQGEVELVCSTKRPQLQAGHMSTDGCTCLTWCMATDKYSSADNNNIYTIQWSNGACDSIISRNYKTSGNEHD